MSETSQGPGWWMASDGKWYPPDQAPGPASSEPTQPLGAAPSWSSPTTDQPTTGGGSTPSAWDAPITTAVPSSDRPRPAPLGWWLMIGGGAVAVLAAFMPWATVGPFSATGTDGDGVLTLLAGIAVVVFGVLGLRGIGPKKLFEILGLVFAAGILIIGLYDTINIGRAANEPDAAVFDIEVDVGVGLILTDMAAVVALVGGFFALIGIPRSSAAVGPGATHEAPPSAAPSTWSPPASHSAPPQAPPDPWATPPPSAPPPSAPSQSAPPPSAPSQSPMPGPADGPPGAVPPG